MDLLEEQVYIVAQSFVGRRLLLQVAHVLLEGFQRPLVFVRVAAELELRARVELAAGACKWVHWPAIIATSLVGVDRLL